MASAANLALETKIVRVHEMEAVISSAPMIALMSMVQRVARGNAAILITGETGVGKELIARAIHAHSLRAARPWVDINCAALPEHLVESELFGYEKGAFSGADTTKPGLFELADQGTLFLDEIGELESRVQAKLLRILDGVPYYRLGGTRKVSVDVRIVAATNRSLEDAIQAGRFRSDLYHRLSQFQLRVPPLRERIDDIAALAEHFLRQSYPQVRLSRDAIGALQTYSWPGNVRELRNIALQAAMNAPGDEIRIEDLPQEFARAGATGEGEAAREHGQPAALDSLEKQAILRTLAYTSGHQGLAAARLGISRRTLSRKLKQYRIDERKVRSLRPPDQQYFRATVAVPISIVSPHGEQVLTSRNVSAGGLGVQGVIEATRLEGELSVEFVLPGEQDRISAHAQLVWSDAQGRAGMRFTGMEDACAQRMQQWLHEKQAEESWTAGTSLSETGT